MYKLINNITGRTSENPMPENVSDETLVNDFENFFMDKIQKICDALQQYDKYMPSRNTNVNILSCFTEMTEDEVIKIIGEMSPKSCELDAIPSSTFKKAGYRSCTNCDKIGQYLFNNRKVYIKLENIDN